MGSDVYENIAKMWLHRLGNGQHIYAHSGEVCARVSAYQILGKFIGELDAGRLTFDRLRIQNVLRCNEVFHSLDSWTPTDWATALAGEVGEACNDVKKLRRLDTADSDQDTPEERRRIARRVVIELADVIMYADLLAARLGESLGDAVREKFNLVSDQRGSKIKL